MAKLPKNVTAPRHQVRCAVYTRKSSEEGLDQDFNSLDAQREAGESYIASQRHEGWVLLPDRYDDGGFTGGNLERPALRRLLAEVEQGRIDCIVVYKVDRLSRSLMDFTKLVEVFDKHRVSFVSVTQQFNTANSMGRLVLNVLLSFAQFEREIISERTRDKLAAMRRKGMWVGGLPPLGYDVDPMTSKLRINADEAARVVRIFTLYREHRGLLPVVEAIREYGWVNKQFTTSKGTRRGGKPFDRTSLYRLLTNVAYIGQVQYGGEIFPSEHAGIVAPELFTEVQQYLRRNGTTGGAQVRNASGALLKGLLRCASCGCAMTPSYTTKGTKRYRYYVCSAAQKNGRDRCPTKSISAGAIEQYVVNQIRCLGQDQQLLDDVVVHARAFETQQRTDLATERRLMEKDLAGWRREVQALAPLLAEASTSTLQELARLQDAIQRAEERLRKIAEREQVLTEQTLPTHELRAAMTRFDGVWEAMTPNEQGRLLGLLIAEVVYDGASQRVAINFQPHGIRSLTDYVQQQGA